MKIKVNDFSGGFREDKSDNLKSLGVASKMLNFDASSGSLRCVKNVSRFDFPLGEIDLSGGKVFFFKKYNFSTQKREDKLIFLDSTLNAYALELTDKESGLRSLGVQFLSPPTALNYRLDGEDVIILVSKEDNMVVWDGVNTPEIVLDAPKVESMDIHYERLFAVTSGGDGAELKFSDDLDPTNWSESLSDAGTIQLVDDRGRLLKVVSFNDYLYIFREYGITRLYANTALQTSFYVNHLFTSGGRILKNTISLAGDHVFFMSTDGFYVFDGASTKKVLEHIFPLIEFSGDESAIFFNGNYYLTCKLKNGDGEKVLLEIRRSDFSVKIITGLNPSGVATLSQENLGALIVVSEDKGAPIFVVGEEDKIQDALSLKALWQSPFLNFDEQIDRKIVRKVEFCVKNPNASMISFFVLNEEGKSVRIETSKERFSSNLFFEGKEFSVGFEACDKMVEIVMLSMEIKGG